MKNVIHQLNTVGISGLDGMSYVIECDDGSIVVVDGGMHVDAASLVEHLKKYTAQRRPRVDLWIFTHPHADHTFCFIEASKSFKDDLDVKTVYCNFAEDEFFERIQPSVIGENKAFFEGVRAFGAEHRVAQRGDRFKFGSVEIEVLYTYSDLPPISERPQQNTNDTSTVFRLNCKGQSVLFLGDVEREADLVMMKLYGDKLKSDVCQVAHHGCYSSTCEFYDFIKPEILLWPVAQERFVHYINSVKASHYLVSQMGVKDIFLEGHGDFDLELPIKPRENPFLPEVPQISMKKPGVRLQLKKADFSEGFGFDSEQWKLCEDIPVDGKLVGRTGTDAVCKFLWDEEHLYFYAKVNKPIVSEPDRLSCLNTDVVRLDLAEVISVDPFVRWNELLDDPDYIYNLKCFGEVKNVLGGKYNNNIPDRCESFSKTNEDSYEVCAKVKFNKSHKKGDKISFNLEIDGVDAPQSYRAFSLNLVRNEDGLEHLILPSDTVFAVLD